MANLYGADKSPLRRSNQRRAEPLLDAERRRDTGVTKLTPRDENDLSGYKKKALYSCVLLIFFFAIIITRLWFLQIQQGSAFGDLADNNRVRSIEIAAPRGNIYDRKGRELVTNRPSFNVVWMRENNKIDDEWLKNLTQILHQDPSILLEKIRKMANTPGHLPVRLAEDIDWETVARIENNRMYLPEIKIEVVPLRIYHYGNLASHLIGYMGEINKPELDKTESNPESKGRYRGGDLIGKMGLERLREVDLRGEKGHHNVEVNALGFEQQNLKGDEPLPGNDIKLTLDLELQKIAEEEMSTKNQSGAVVAMEATTGRILVAASAPELDLGEFVGGISHKAWQEMLNNPLHPLINKLIQGQYPPGSTYKPVTAFAGLAEGVITPDTSVFCPGFYRFGNRVYRCWKHSGHGTVSLKRALSESCDVYFYQVGQRLGVDRLARYAKLFGLGAKTGVEMEHEKPGIVPSTDWKKKRYGVKWHEGETLSVAIGQGYDLTTPLQIALMTSVIANGGTLYKPTVVEEVTDPDGKLVSSFKPEIISRISGQGRNLKLVREGMVEAVNGRHGTGRAAQVEAHGIIVGGKTGTAQVVRLAQYKHLKEANIPYEYRDHAWFTCFAPAINPEIVVSVLVEHGLHGGSASAPIAAKILNKYFEDKLKGQDEANNQPTKGRKVILSQEMIEETDPSPPDDEESNLPATQPSTQND
ncbi:MAG: penicillin-binding protein 2 [Desulfobulbus sp.]